MEITKSSTRPTTQRMMVRRRPRPAGRTVMGSAAGPRPCVPSPLILGSLTITGAVHLHGCNPARRYYTIPQKGVSILVLLEAGDHEMLWPGVARTPKSPAAQQPRVPKWKPPSIIYGSRYSAGRLSLADRWIRAKEDPDIRVVRDRFEAFVQVGSVVTVTGVAVEDLRSTGTRGGCVDLAQTWFSSFRSGFHYGDGGLIRKIRPGEGP